MTTDLIVYGDGSTGPLLPPAAALGFDVAAVVRQAVRFLKDFNSPGTQAAYARDLGVPYLVDAYSLASEVESLSRQLECHTVWNACKPRKPSKRTVAADLTWLVSCAKANLDPFADVEGEHIRLWVTAVQNRRHPDGKQAIDTAAQARRVSTVSSLYKWAVEDDLANANPVDRLNRKRHHLRVSRHHTATSGLDGGQLDTLVFAADHYPSATQERNAAITALMATIGCRVEELILLDVADYHQDQGCRVVDLTRKGGKKQRVPVPPVAVERIDAYLAARRGGGQLVLATQAGSGNPGKDVPLFASVPYRNRPGGGRLYRAEVRDMLRRVAASHPDLADVAHDLHPHVLRHSVATRLLAAGVPLHDVQKLLGHIDPNTTQIYNHAVQSLAGSPAHDAGRMLAAGLASLEAKAKPAA